MCCAPLSQCSHCQWKCSPLRALADWSHETWFTIAGRHRGSFSLGGKEGGEIRGRARVGCTERDQWTLTQSRSRAQLATDWHGHGLITRAGPKSTSPTPPSFEHHHQSVTIYLYSTTISTTDITNTTGECSQRDVFLRVPTNLVPGDSTHLVRETYFIRYCKRISIWRWARCIFLDAGCTSSLLSNPADDARLYAIVNM